MPKETFRYSLNELTVIWKPNACIHSRNCWTQLGEVFNPKERPWIKMDGASMEAIIEQVKKCPSGALSYELANMGVGEAANENSDGLATKQRIIVQPQPNGPLLIKTPCIVQMADGTEVVKETSTAFCRCGQSQHKPFCDGSHKKVNFQAP